MMNDQTPAEAIQIATEKRILNEFGSKILNEERMEHVVESRKGTRLSTHSDMTFRCECDDKTCDKTIQLSTEGYRHVHTKTKHFIVVPPQVRLDLEKIITSFNDYVLVEKFFPYAAK
jgi:hypothetical protein